ncbi:hypothetical protein NDU88_004225 [Pleurodeles waltl]|uniref:Uncharacterized protein n=1 Tax=Pleurodeles waltl TaxID=8319 RepID=A0AAV7RKX6_PLEWA|nr:hypothetical protein NDU88_004225 [Pleurodeles waltl]
MPSGDNIENPSVGFDVGPLVREDGNSDPYLSIGIGVGGRQLVEVEGKKEDFAESIAVDGVGVGVSAGKKWAVDGAVILEVAAK